MAAGSESQTFDFAIVGAGVSGLVLAWLLAESSLKDRSILLIDGARDDEQLRTLSFWSPDGGPLESLVRHRYTTLRVFDGMVGQDVALQELVYRTIFFADLQEQTKARLGRHGQHRVVCGHLSELCEDDAGCSLTVDGQSYQARFVFDSRFRRTQLAVDERRYHLLWQHIHGWAVSSPQAAFEPGVATLIDFRVVASSGCRPGTVFIYVLPWSRTEALVELVSLHPVDPEPLLQEYLRQIHGITHFQIHNREAGISPMTEQPFARQQGTRVRRIGIPAGRLKASTGYAVTRIIEDCEAIVHSLVENGHPFAAPGDSRFFQFLDAILLEVWKAEPERIPDIFAAMFSLNEPDVILHFLDERASLGQILGMIATLPVAPFLRALARYLGRRIGLLAAPTDAQP